MMQLRLHFDWVYYLTRMFGLRIVLDIFLLPLVKIIRPEAKVPLSAEEPLIVYRDSVPLSGAEPLIVHREVLLSSEGEPLIVHREVALSSGEVTKILPQDLNLSSGEVKLTKRRIPMRLLGGGGSNTASGIASFVGGGTDNVSSAEFAFVGGGFSNIASEARSFIGGGDVNTASGFSAFVGGGQRDTASGNYTFIGGGIHNTAPSYGEAVFGIYNTSYTPNSATLINNNDRIFTVGNGTSTTNRRNALTILKNGNIGIGNSNPQYRLDVDGQVNIKTNGVVLRANGHEALWYNDTYFSWGFGGQYNFFADTVLVGGSGGSVRNYLFRVNGTAAKTGGGSWDNTSDQRLKHIDGDYTRGLDDITALHPVRFHYRVDNPHGLDSESEQIGFIAQEVQTVFPEAVTTLSDGYLSLNLHPVNVALVNAVKELKNENVDLKSAITELERKYESNLKTLEQKYAFLADQLASIRDLQVQAVKEE